MKKILTAILALSLALLSLLSCAGMDLSNGNADDEKNDAPTEVTYLGLDVTIPEGFSQSEKSNTFYNDDMLIRIMASSKAGITPNEGYDFPTVTEFFDNIPTFTDELVYLQRDGYTYADYPTTKYNVASIFAISEDEGTQTVFFLENEQYFYAISFYSSTMEYEDAKEEAFELIENFKPQE